jgi:hypothetical protein
VTEPARVALLLILAWLLAAVTVLAAQGMLVPWLLAAAAGSAAVLLLRALVRQQRAPSVLDRPPLPERYRVADDLQQPLSVVVAVAEEDAASARPRGRCSGALDES